MNENSVTLIYSALLSINKIRTLFKEYKQSLEPLTTGKDKNRPHQFGLT